MSFSFQSEGDISLSEPYFFKLKWDTKGNFFKWRREMLNSSVLCIIFKGQRRSSQLAISHRLYGESDAIEAEGRHTEGWEVTGNKNIHLHPCMLAQWADRQDFPMECWSPHPWMWHLVFWADCRGGERGQRLELLILEVFSTPSGPVICFILRVSVQPCNSPSTSETCCEERQLPPSCGCLSHSVPVVVCHTRHPSPLSTSQILMETPPGKGIYHHRHFLPQSWSYKGISRYVVSF